MRYELYLCGDEEPTMVGYADEISKYLFRNPPPRWMDVRIEIEEHKNDKSDRYCRK